MRNTTTNSDNSSFSGVLVLVLIALLYWAWYLLQPSAVPATDPLGKPIDRLTELLVMPLAAVGVFGYGAQSLGGLDKLPLIVGAVAWLVLAWWMGRPLVDRVLGHELRLVRIAVAVLVGLAWLSTTTLLVGLAGGLSTRMPLLLAVSALAFVAWLLRFRGSPNSDAPVVQPAPECLTPDNLFGAWSLRLVPLATGLLIAVYVLGAAMPAWEFDVLEYHLQAPKEFYTAGKIHFIEHNVYANMPLGAEMHSLATMTLVGGARGWWIGALIGKLVTAAYSLLAAMAIGGFVAKRYGVRCGWGAAGLFLATAGTVHVSVVGLIDMVLGAYVGAACLVIACNWQQLKSDGAGKVVLLVGTLVGAAAASKYTGLVYAVLPAVALIGLAGFKQGSRRVGWSMAVFLLALSATCVPWLVKNAVQTGNPVYPLVASVFEVPGLSDSGLERWETAHRVQADGGNATYGLAALLQSIHRVIVGSPFVNPSLLLLAAVGVVLQARRLNQHRWVPFCLLGIVWILAVWWCSTHRIDRFWMPIVPLSAMLSGLGLASLGRGGATTLAAGLLVCGIGYGVLKAVSGMAQNDNRFFVALHELEAEHVGATANGYLAASAWVNENLGDDSRLLCVGDAKAFDYRIPIVWSTCFNVNPGEAWLSGVAPEQARSNLIQNGITHVLVHWGEIARYRSPMNYGFSSWPTEDDIGMLEEQGVLRTVDGSPGKSYFRVFEVVQ